MVDPAFSQKPADVSRIDHQVTRPGRLNETVGHPTETQRSTPPQDSPVIQAEELSQSCVRISHFEGFKQRPSVEPSCCYYYYYYYYYYYHYYYYHYYYYYYYYRYRCCYCYYYYYYYYYYKS